MQLNILEIFYLVRFKNGLSRQSGSEYSVSVQPSFVPNHDERKSELGNSM
jgi:hypothetical protein